MGPGDGNDKASPEAPPQHPPSQNGDAAAPVHVAYDVAFEYAVDCQIVTDVHGLILNVNHAGVRFLSLEKGFLVGKPLGLLLRTDSRTPFYNHLARFTRGVASCSFESSVTVRDRKHDILVIGVIDSPTTIRWILRDTTRWKQAEVARVELLRQLLTVQTDERRRLARDLHDNVGQLLTGLTLSIGSIAQGSTLSRNGQRALQLAEKILTELRQAVHDIAHGFRSGLLEEVGLSSALKQLVSEWQDLNASVNIKLDLDDIGENQVPREIETVAYAMVQEALTNVHRHANAHLVQVRVEHDAAALIVTVRNDGAGFDARLASHQSSVGRLGLVGMEERVALVGGHLKIDTAPGKGTKLTAADTDSEVRKEAADARG